MKQPVLSIDPNQAIDPVRIAILHETIKALWGPSNATPPPPIVQPSPADQTAFDAENGMGPKTKALVTQFQHSSSLAETGVVDDKTAAAMNAALVKVNQ